MRALLFLPALIFFLLPILHGIVQKRRKARLQRELAERRRIKAEIAARAKAERDAQKAAAKAATATKVAAQPKRKRGRPRKNPAQDAPAAAQTTPAVQAAPESNQPESKRSEGVSEPAKPAALPGIKGNNAFAHEVVAFTGTLDGMTRAEAIKAVEANGGRAFQTMPAGTTLLVVGRNPGMSKLDKADKWISQTRKITQEQFKAKIDQPFVSFTPDEFAARFAPNA